MHGNTTIVDDWLRSVALWGVPIPNRRQLAFLEAAGSQLKAEILDERRGCVADTILQPFIDLAYGFPGAGKSSVIEWTQRILPKLLGLSTVLSSCVMRIPTRWQPTSTNDSPLVRRRASASALGGKISVRD